MSEDPNALVKIPRWLWGILIALICAAFPLTGEVYSLRSENSQQAQLIVALTAEVAEIRLAVQTTREEQLRRTNPVYSVGDLKTELANLRSVLEEVRDDVIVLKTQRP